MPLMAGSPGLSLPKGGGCSGGVAVRLYSGGDERCARGRGPHQRGLANPSGRDGEGRGKELYVAANGRAKNGGHKGDSYESVNATRLRTTGTCEEGHVYNTALLNHASSLLLGSARGNLCNTSRRWDREATQHLK